MLMGQTLGEYLSDLVSFDALSMTQMDYILSAADNTTLFDRSSVFATDESKDGLRTYLYAEVSAALMEEETAERIASKLSLGALYPEETLAELEGFVGPVPKVYEGDGNLQRLGSLKTRSTSISSNIFNGIWGISKGAREYALMCSTWGLEIIDITNPGSPFRVQGVQMSGGLYWRDVATHETSTGESECCFIYIFLYCVACRYVRSSNSATVVLLVYAYIAAQDFRDQQSDLFVFNLSRLSGDSNNPNGADSNPIPSGSNGYLNLGENNYGHTLNVGGGFLFLNSQSEKTGCRVYDLSVPMSPKYLFSHSGNGNECHDSSLWENVDVGGENKKLWIISDGSARVDRIYDFTSVTSNTVSEPPLISTTPKGNGIYAHSNTLYKNRFLFQFDENNEGDIYVYDCDNWYEPVLINTIQWSGEGSTGDAIPHNGWAQGNYLYVAYYEAGLRCLDISNPYLIVEVGRVNTWTDPDGDGSSDRKIKGDMFGAWNVYTGLLSGHVLVTDMYAGLFVVKPNPPYSKPDAPSVSVKRNDDDDVILSWDSVPNTRAYSVERSINGQGYEVIAEYLTTTSYVDRDVRDTNAQYTVKAVNGEGVGFTPPIESTSRTPSPTTQPTPQPSPQPTPGPSPQPTPQPSPQPTPGPSPQPTPQPSPQPTPGPSPQPTPQPSPQPTPDPTKAPITPAPSAAPTTAEPTKEMFYRGSDGCIRDGEVQVNQCWATTIPNPRAVSCCEDTNEGVKCRRKPNGSCNTVSTFFEAEALCSVAGMRLCSIQELESGVCCNGGCNFDARVNWTSSSCDASTENPTKAPTLPPTTSNPTPNPTPVPTPTPPTSVPTPSPTPNDGTDGPTTPFPTFFMTAEPTRLESI